MKRFSCSIFDQEWILAIQQAKINSKAVRKEQLRINSKRNKFINKKHNLNSFKGK